MPQLPKHSQLRIPLLETLEETEGMRAKDAARAVAKKLDLSTETTEGAVERTDRGTMNVWERRVRWVRQTLVNAGMVANTKRNWWELTDRGKGFLLNARPGVVVTVFETDAGVALWARAETAVAYVRDGSVDLMLTSPEYPLVKPKQYGNRQGDRYLDWLTELAADWKPKLKNHGSLILNFQDAYLPGTPELNLYQERLLLRLVDDLGYHLCQRFIAHYPCKIPATDWVTVKRVRITSGFETFYWFGKTANPRADNRRVLQPYGETMLRKLRHGGEVGREIRPSGHGHPQPSFHRDNGGSIPRNVIGAHNATAHDVYTRGCRADGIPIHPARLPDEPVDFLIRFLTEPGDTVCDPLAGSLKVAAVAERLGRRWIASDQSLTYLYGGRHRFEAGRWTGLIPTEVLA